MRRILPFILFASLAFACANITTPSGGPKDEDPPKLISSSPRNKQTNFQGKTVELTFNEAVKINNPKEEIIISPSPGKEVTYKVKGARVSITPEEGWRDTTTYSLQFREGIQDITEGNAPLNLKVAFSTGAQIDSLRITGKVEDLLKGVVAEKITVAIFRQDTFNIFNHTPQYFTKTNKSGRFSLENIKSGTYKIYAFEDKNKNLKVESRTERYGFLATPLTLNKNIDSLSISLIMMDSRFLKINSIRSAGPVTKLRFSKYLVDYKVESDSSLISAFGDNQSELNIWCPENLTDSLKVRLTAGDSLDLRIDSTFYIKKSGRLIKEDLKWSMGDPRVDSDNGKFKTQFSYNKPLSRLDLDSLFIQLDSINKVMFTKDDISIDELHKEFTLTKELDKKIFTSENEPNLTLYAGRGFINTIENDTSKYQKRNITIYWPERTGILLVQVQTDKKDYIIQLLDGGGHLITSIYNVSKYTFKNLTPQDYQIRVIIDENKNKKWDPGNIVKNQEPEKVSFYTAANGKKTFPIRANWELGPLIIKF